MRTFDFEAKDFDFEATDFALSKNGIHLLRNRYNYKTINYKEVNKAIVRKAPEIKNYLLILIFGIILIAFAVKVAIGIIRLFENPDVKVVYIEHIVLPVIPALMGFYMIWTALRRGPILFIETNTTNHQLRLREFKKNGNAAELLTYLSNNLYNKVYVEDTI
jgi:hypothetical protein